MKCEKDKAALIRNAIVTEFHRMQKLEKIRPSRSNLNKAEWSAIKQLRECKQRIIISADKGDKSIVMDFHKMDGDNDI